ncbi:MAG: carboxylesterase family protein, partial [Lachnospiraceae bacterium]|nr:carboxylesterase family protein [Lachnospiraceae bacterium]
MALLQVKTENGIVEGLPSGNQMISIFKGIPFAKPPVGDLRWKAPQPAENWEGVRPCYKFGFIPMQARFASEGGGNTLAAQEFYVIEFPMREDCLYLNIWTPAKAADEKLPVAGYIHG